MDHRRYTRILSRPAPVFSRELVFEKEKMRQGAFFSFTEQTDEAVKGNIF